MYVCSAGGTWRHALPPERNHQHENADSRLLLQSEIPSFSNQNHHVSPKSSFLTHLLLLFSTLWWTCCPRWWRASLTLSAASNRTTTVRPTSSTERRSWCSCGTLESWRQPRSDGRATLTASCSLTSLRGQQAPRFMPRGSGLFKWCCVKMCVSARLITHWLLQVLHLGFPGSRGARCDSRNMFNDTGEGEAGELGDGED